MHSFCGHSERFEFRFTRERRTSPEQMCSWSYTKQIWLPFGKSFRCCDLLQTLKCIDHIRPDCCYFRFSSPVAYPGQFMRQRFFQGGRITRDLLEELQAEEILMTLTDQAAAYFKGIPRLAITISILILSAWLISFIGNLLRYSRFRFYADRKAFSVHRGLISPYRYRLRRGAVNYIDIRQNLMMKLLHLMSVHISCPGYGNQKNELPVLMPLLQKSHADRFLQPLLKQQPNVIGKNKPKQPFNLFRFWLLSGSRCSCWALYWY